jgi:hypothetical protein
MRAHVFRFAPESGHRDMQSACPFRATSGLMHRSKQLYSITSSVRESSIGGMVRARRSLHIARNSAGVHYRYSNEDKISSSSW